MDFCLGFYFRWVTGCSQWVLGCGVLFRWVLGHGLLLGIYFRWVTMMICDWVTVVVGFVVGGGFFLLIVVGSGVGCGGWQGWVAGWVWVAGRALTKADLPNSLRQMDTCLSQFYVEAEKSDLGSWGVIVNSFSELEKDYVASLESLYGNDTRAWCVGPLFLYNDQLEGASIGPDGPFPHKKWDNWLNQHWHENSVIYVSFGSQANLCESQLNELAYGLDLSGKDYIWVVRSKNWEPPSDIDKGRGLIVEEWVDQRWVLAHQAIGGFLSHCGWNSVLESLSNGHSNFGMAHAK
uniref:UDP-glycosyltransferases domain-containing protein n=1 Tax=Fagus sylvatica TaxID=28930 RepID=A0A2N9EZP8_FAGSY